MKHTTPAFDHAEIAYGFFGREGGVSTGIYDSLNCAPGSGDTPDNVLHNRNLVGEALAGVPGELVLAPYQEHGAECFKVEEPFGLDHRPKADALVTDKPGVALSILTADCAPVLFRAPGVVGAAHAGWKGAVGSVLDNVVKAMGDYGAQPSDIHACVGPCIAQRSYEVGADFYEVFIRISEEYERFFQAGARAKHYQFDLAGFCAFRLALAGVRHVHIMGLDTYANEEQFFSYRRSQHRGEADYGRQISVIVLK